MLETVSANSGERALELSKSFAAADGVFTALASGSVARPPVVLKAEVDVGEETSTPRLYTGSNGLVKGVLQVGLRPLRDANRCVTLAVDVDETFGTSPTGMERHCNMIRWETRSVHMR